LVNELSAGKLRQKYSEAVAMGKIVKYCSSCDEGFSEKFGFCPNCAAPLQAFEMNPLDGQAKMDEPIVDIPPAVEEQPVADTVSMSANDTVLEIPEEVRAYVDGGQDTVPSFLPDDLPIEVANADVIEEEEVAEPENEPETIWAAPATIPTGHAPSGTGTHNYDPGLTKEDDGGYYITVIQEKNSKQRNLLLLGSLVLMLSLAFGSYIVSLFQKDLFVGAIGDERSLAYLIDEVPMPVEDEKKPNKEDAGGGGGGGKNDPKPVNQGDLPDQTPDPIRPPDPKVHRMDDPALVLPPPSTQGNVKTPKNFDRWGDPNSRFSDLSSGPGSGGGMGTGIGTGAGSGRGTGMGSGTGSGSGSGNGEGNGPGTGGGTGGLREPPKAPVGVTSPFRILAKPRATYTDEARTANVQGSVLVKVTLLASGQVGNVSVVRGLPHGLSERAIAAARQIRFEPKKVNGQPVSVTQTFEYSFSIY
jgi:TonB family protein